MRAGRVLASHHATRYIAAELLDASMKLARASQLYVVYIEHTGFSNLASCCNGSCAVS